MESDPVMYTALDPSLLPGDEHDIVECMEGTTWSKKFNVIFTGNALKNDFVVGCVFRAPCQKLCAN